MEYRQWADNPNYQRLNSMAKIAPELQDTYRRRFPDCICENCKQHAVEHDYNTANCPTGDTVYGDPYVMGTAIWDAMGV